MHIIIGVLLALAAALWAFSRFVDAADDAHSAARRFSWSRKHIKRVIDTLDDPREAAAILMLQIAAYEGELTARQRNTILDEMRVRFRASDAEAEEFFGIARHALGQTNDVANSLRKVLAPIQKALGEHEREELMQMLENVAAAGDGPTERQAHLIASVRRALF